MVRNMLFVLTLLILISALSTLCFSQPPEQPAKSAVIITFKEIPQEAVPVSQEQAVATARRLLGLTPATSHQAQLGLATDNTVPFLKIANRLAWKIIFDGIVVSFTDADGTEMPKQEFSTLTCLLDAQTGALLKISSLTPVSDSAARCENNPGELEEEMYHSKMSLASMDAANLTQTDIEPLIPLLLEIEKSKSNTIKPATQLVAYFGLFTSRARPSRPIVDQPYWIIMTGGLQRQLAVPVGNHKASDAWFWVDACSGKLLFWRQAAFPQG